ncbi:ParB/RepB/Spo0J family partition protein [Nocardia jinanensis]|uniref:ParB-like N-terminal domain-containing protein n=1 Tax=Nocardia jinanensis TaxID=382504 RepID=A0A917RYW6_9NOCA|nr:ParB/RepB/Spo0J family partition protein [Nocardia jinanensis]GGL45860.1 hypothetical protein GCM10011588_70760 [Nocardia jinanensis]
MSSTSLAVVTDPDDTPDSPPATAENRSRPADAAYMHPDDVLIADNVSTTFDLADHPEQIASIREFGVGLPIRAERDPDGTVHAIDGQLRVLIAREIGLTEIPVWIVDAPTGDDRERRIARTLTQINLNDRRVPLTAGVRAAGVAQMLDLGASVTRVAKGLQTNRDRGQTVSSHRAIGDRAGAAGWSPAISLACTTSAACPESSERVPSAWPNSESPLRRITPRNDRGGDPHGRCRRHRGHRHQVADPARWSSPCRPPDERTGQNDGGPGYPTAAASIGTFGEARAMARSSQPC